MSSYSYTCEGCGDIVEMTREKFLRLPTGAYGRRVRCDDCLAKQKAKAFRSPRVGGSTARRIACDECGAGNPQKAYRLNERNWREHYRLLCNPCTSKLAYTPVDWSRPAVEGTKAPALRGKQAA